MRLWSHRSINELSKILWPVSALLQGIAIAVVLSSCGKEEDEKLLEIKAPSQATLYIGSGMSCLERRHPGLDGSSRDVPGPYTVQLRDVKLTWNSNDAFEIRMMQLRFRSSSMGGDYSKTIDVVELSALYDHDDDGTDNEEVWNQGFILPPITGKPPYVLSTYSTCAVVFGGIQIEDDRKNASAAAELIIRGQKIKRDKNGDLTLEEAPISVVVPVNITYEGF